MYNTSSHVAVTNTHLAHVTVGSFG